VTVKGAAKAGPAGPCLSSGEPGAALVVTGATADNAPVSEAVSVRTAPKVLASVTTAPAPPNVVGTKTVTFAGMLLNMILTRVPEVAELLAVLATNPAPVRTPVPVSEWASCHEPRAAFPAAVLATLKAFGKASAKITVKLDGGTGSAGAAPPG